MIHNLGTVQNSLENLNARSEGICTQCSYWGLWDTNPVMENEMDKNIKQRRGHRNSLVVYRD